MRIWEPLVYPNARGLTFPDYEVSSTGEVRNINRGRYILPPEIDEYLRLTLYSKDGKRQKIMIHRAVAIAFVPNPQRLRFVHHKDHNKHNNLASNLEWISASDNVKEQHKILEKPKKTKIMQAQCNRLYDLYIEHGLSISELEQLFDIDQRTIYHIINEKNGKSPSSTRKRIDVIKQ